jgi:hypothetical protein
MVYRSLCCCTPATPAPTPAHSHHPSSPLVPNGLLPMSSCSAPLHPPTSCHPSFHHFTPRPITPITSPPLEICRLTYELPLCPSSSPLSTFLRTLPPCKDLLLFPLYYHRRISQSQGCQPRSQGLLYLGTDLSRSLFLHLLLRESSLPSPPLSLLLLSHHADILSSPPFALSRSPRPRDSRSGGTRPSSTTEPSTTPAITRSSPTFNTPTSL